MPTSRSVHVRGLDFRVFEWPGNGPPALFAHATGFHGAVWDPVARALAGRFRAFAPDSRGHGGSDKPEGPYDWGENAADVIALADALEIRGALAIGHSYGATALAIAGAERPDLFSRLVMIDPTLFLDHERSRSGTRLAAAVRKRRNGWRNRAAVIASYRGKPPFDSWAEGMLELYVEHGTVEGTGGEVTLACPPEIEARIYEGSRSLDPWPALERLGIPVLAIRGERSDTFTDERVRRTRRALANGRIVVMGNTSHLALMERPSGIIDAIDRFLEEGTPAIRTGTLAHVALNVTRLEETERFYREQLGMKVVWRPDPDNVYLSSGRDNLALHRAEARAPGTPSPLDHIGFVVASRDEVFAAASTLEARGFVLAKAPKVHRDESTSFYVNDPDGNLVQVIHLPDSMLPAQRTAEP